MNRIGHSAVTVPRVGFGAAAIGNLYESIDEEDAAGAIASAVAHGLSYFDTAPHYGFGLSERRLGSALANIDADEKAIVSTKVGRTLIPIELCRGAQERHGFVDAAPFEPVFDYSYDAVMRSYEASRKRLRRERIDILFAHDLGEVTHGADHDRQFATFMAGGYRAMRELRDSGAVGAIGLGANEWQVCERAMSAGTFDVCLLAGRYTLLEQTALDSFLPECARRNVSVVIGGPFNSGALVEGGSQKLHYNYAPAPEWVVRRVQALKAACARHGVKLPAAALQFPLLHPQVASVIPGLANASQVQQTVDFMNADIPADFWAELKARGLLHPDAPVSENQQ